MEHSGDCVVYWMQRSQRASDNLALSFAASLANELDKPLLVYFGLHEGYPMGSVRVFRFLLQGLSETIATLEARGVGFLLRRECPADGIAKAAREFHACAVVVDQDYLRTGRAWRERAAADVQVRMCQVDADTVVGCAVSAKEEWGAYTLRPKILKVLDQHLVETPDLWPAREWTSDIDGQISLRGTELIALADDLGVEQDVSPLDSICGGFSEAMDRLDDFVDRQLPLYDSQRNDIGVDVSSGLSPYLHFGQISPLRVALSVGGSDAPDDCVDAFLEQLIVRRELAINFCVHNDGYDTIHAAPEWAAKTLREHSSDPRDEVYSLEELEGAATHDDLWNAAQRELVKSGKIHPYMRMVWAKKLLEWSESAEDALARAIHLNDKYALDGRDPNGYANIAWCILGKHDRPFASRPVFGKVRYMSSAATKRKTHWQDYIRRVDAL